MIHLLKDVLSHLLLYFFILLRGCGAKKMENLILVILEKVLEAVYFALFLIYGKKLEKKRLLFMILMVAEYLLLTSFIYYNVMFQLLYIFLSYVILKVLYREKAQITDIFLMAVASIILIAFSAFTFLTAYYTYNNYLISLIINRILIFGFIFIFGNKINNVYKMFYQSWNRHSNPKKIKSLTLRNISIIIFNLMFVLINFGMIYTSFF